MVKGLLGRPKYRDQVGIGAKNLLFGLVRPLMPASGRQRAIAPQQLLQRRILPAFVSVRPRDQVACAVGGGDSGERSK